MVGDSLFGLSDGRRILFQHLCMSSVSSISHISMFGVGSGNSNDTKENLGAWALF